MVDGMGGDRQHGEGGEDCKERHEIKTARCGEGRANQPSYHGNENIAGPVDHWVATYRSGQASLIGNASRDCRYCRREEAPATAIRMSAVRTTGKVGATQWPVRLPPERKCRP